MTWNISFLCPFNFEVWWAILEDSDARQLFCVILVGHKVYDTDFVLGFGSDLHKFLHKD